MESEAHFGGLVVVFSGDFDQLAPVPLPSMVKVGLGCTKVKPGSPAALARDIFQHLDLCPSTEGEARSKMFTVVHECKRGM